MADEGTRARDGHRFAAALIGLTVAAAVLGAQQLGLLDELEAMAMDALMRVRGDQPADERIVICDIDARSIDRFGLWPWPRCRSARLIEGLAAGGATVVALDVMFGESANDMTTDCEPAAESGPAEVDRVLADTLGRANNVVLGYFFRRDPVPELTPAEIEPNARMPQTRPPDGGFESIPERPAVHPNLPLIARAARAQGFFSNERRRGILRHYDLVVRYRDRYYPALALQAVRLYRGDDLRLTHDARRVIPVLELGKDLIETDESARLWLDYRGVSPYRRISAVDVLEDRVPADALRDRLVFVGASEVGIGDLYATPFGAEVPGVEVHAHAADNLLNGDYIVDGAWQRALSIAALLALALAVAALVTSMRRYLLGSLLAIALVALWPLLSYLVFSRLDRHLLTAAPVLAGALSLLVALRYQIGFVEKRKREIERSLRHYVSPAVVDELLERPETLALGGKNAVVTVLFCDISGFTNMAEKLAPEEVVRRLNQFFTPMTRIVLDSGGTLDKYMGDALMAFFGAPGPPRHDHAARACAAALEMSDALDRLNQGWRERGLLAGGDPGLGMGVGMSSGEVVVGNMGSDTIFDYTVIGDPVNLGSRVEGLTRRYRCRILVTQPTRDAAGEGFLFRELDRVQVKGKRAPAVIHELLARAPVPDHLAIRAERFGRGLEAYRRRDFTTATAIFERLLDDAPDDGPAAVFLERCRGYRETPPEPDWQPMETLTTK